MLVSDLTEQNISDEIIDKLLFEGLDYKGDKGDIIVVLGSKKLLYIEYPLQQCFIMRKEAVKL